MPLVPGIALTTSIRDFFNGDYLSGAIHMIDAILTAFSIAVGVALLSRFTSLSQEVHYFDDHSVSCQLSCDTLFCCIIFC